jgi:hypothetical protein
MLPSGVAQIEKDDHTPEEWQFFMNFKSSGTPLGNKPLITMIGMKEAEDRPAPMSVEQWHTLHQEKIEQKRAFVTLSTNSKAVEVQDAGHSIHLEDPDAVVNAIHDVMNVGSDKCLSSYRLVPAQTAASLPLRPPILTGYLHRQRGQDRALPILRQL